MTTPRSEQLDEIDNLIALERSAPGELQRRDPPAPPKGSARLDTAKIIANTHQTAARLDLSDPKVYKLLERSIYRGVVRGVLVACL